MADERPAAMEMPHPRQFMESLRGGRIGRLLEWIGLTTPRPVSGEGLLDLAGALLSLRGRASGPALASAFFDGYEASDIEARWAFLARLHAQYPRDGEAIDRAVALWVEQRDTAAAQALVSAAGSPCERLIHLLNLAPGGTRRLIAMRADLLSAPDMTEKLRDLDRKFEDAFAVWFNAGFLELRRIDWTSPAAVLERIIRYEAVHSMDGWDDLRRRVEPADRRCYAFFHPQMQDDPLIFVEVALTDALPSGIRQIIGEARQTVDPRSASHAIFYSISNCQHGLRGIPFGNFLIKQVVELLKAELPQLKRFATLSPVPGFAAWLKHEQAGEDLRAAAARFITTARDRKGQVRDPVARFHLSNGARLEAVHSDADLSDKGRREGHGVMVNYLYDLGEIEANHVRLFELDSVAVSSGVAELLKPARSANSGKNKARRAELDGT